MAHRPKIDNSIIGVRSNQNLSCNWTGSADFGRLVPFHWEELLETDKVITCKPRIEMQMLPLASPTFGKIDLYVHYFVVPLRQLQDHFYDIWSQTGVYKAAPFPWVSPRKLQQIYNSSTVDAQKRALFKHWTSLGLNPFFAIPNSHALDDNDTPISLFPFRAYNKIWWDFYRDPELIRDTSKSQYLQTIDIANNPDLSDGYRFMYPHVRSIKNNWISDLFSEFGTSPNSDGFGDVFNDSKILQQLETGESEKIFSESNLSSADVSDQKVYPNVQTAQFNRVIESLTRLSERLSLSGKREIEALFARYGVKPKWSEMNLCRYVGGSKSTVLVSDITATADTVNGDGGSPLGRKAGAGYCALNDLNIEVQVDEPSILMGILSVMPHIHFVQGISKKWQRRELTDMFQKSLEHVGQVAVAKREIAKNYDLDGASPGYLDGEDGQTFAYSDPYYEYKMGLDILAGDFMKYHSSESENDTTLYMQSMEQYIDFPEGRDFSADNLKVDGDAFNKIFYYLGGSVDEDVDDHFHLCIDKDVLINRPMEGYAIPTLETTQNPHESKTQLSADKML